MENKLLTVDPQRLLRLEVQEGIFHASGRRAIEEVIEAGRALYTIKSEDLWTARPEFEIWSDYVENYLGLEINLATRWLHVHRVAVRLESAGLMLPENESQAVELARAPEERLVPIWQSLVKQLEGVNQSLTVELIKQAVVIDEREREPDEKSGPPPTRKSSGKGVTITLSDDDEEEDDKEPTALKLTETGEAALDKIKKICGKEVAQAISDGRLKIVQRDLIQWASQEDQLVHNLAYYIAQLRWSLTKALNYEEQLIDSETTIDQLLTLTRARGGRFAFSYETARFSVETSKK